MNFDTQIIKEFLAIFWPIIKAWWWLPLPFWLFAKLKFLYLWYIQDEFWAKINWTVLEVKMPKDNLRPLKAMEQVISSFWVLYDPFDFKEKWFEGKFLLPFQLEIAGVDGMAHFFVRLPGAMRNAFESAMTSQYTDLEIEEVDDYTKMVPQDIPNKDWDMWACNFKMLKPDCYPIKTYKSFFEPTQDVKEEKRIDPLSVLLEGMSRLKEGEQLWLQLILRPMSPKESDWVERGKQELNKLLKRPTGASSEKSIVGSAWDLFFHNIAPFSSDEKKEESVIPSEMRLSPGERDVVQAIEEKIGKNGFQTTMRMIYLGKKDVFFKPNLRLILNFSTALQTQNLNGITPTMTTKVVPPAFFRQRRVHLKKRGMWRRYQRRQSPFYPKDGGTFTLNAEEIATLWHFPGKTGIAGSNLPLVESKKSSPDPFLPIE